jgi:hypothetical protein
MAVSLFIIGPQARLGTISRSRRPSGHKSVGHAEIAFSGYDCGAANTLPAALTGATAIPEPESPESITEFSSSRARTHGKVADALSHTDF